MTTEQMQDRVIAIQDALKGVDGDVLVCDPSWCQSLTDALMGGVDGDVTDTGAFGMKVVEDYRFDQPVVIEFTEPCLKEV